jgi:hypothetical protein
MQGEPAVLHIPRMGGTMVITISGNTVVVRGAHRVKVEMPITTQYGGKPRFASDDADKPTETFVVDTLLTCGGLEVYAGLQVPEDEAQTRYNAPYLRVAGGLGSNAPKVLTIVANRPVGDPDDISQPRHIELQKLTFEPVNA